MGGATGLEPAALCVRGGGAVVVVINSDRCGVFGTYWDGTVLVAEACNHPNCQLPDGSSSRLVEGTLPRQPAVLGTLAIWKSADGTASHWK
jgi:hypothetical protein